MREFWHFIQYHNAVPIALGILLLGAGGAFAATNPEAIYSSAQTVLSVDNTYIAGKDLSAYSPKVEIVSVTEDGDNYYVAYKFSTIDLQNAVWRDVVKDGTMTVSKADLGPYRDLGLYVTGQLKQVIDRELQRLVETQKIERKDVTQKTVATTYGGLVGKLLDDNTETLPGYTPIVVPPVAPEPIAVGPAAGSEGASAASRGSGTGASNAAAPIIQILGRNPAVVPTGSAYADLGAVFFDDKSDNFPQYVLLDGREVASVQLDTSTSTEYRITYRATDLDGNTTEVSRTVIVYDRTQPPPVVEQIPPMQVPEVRAIEEQSAVSPQEPPPAEPTPPPVPEATTSTQAADSAEIVPAEESTSTDASTATTTP